MTIPTASQFAEDFLLDDEPVATFGDGPCRSANDLATIDWTAGHDDARGKFKQEAQGQFEAAGRQHAPSIPGSYNLTVTVYNIDSRVRLPTGPVATRVVDPHLFVGGKSHGS